MSNLNKITAVFAAMAAGLELARACGHTGEPMIRHLDYMFPGQGYGDVADKLVRGKEVAPVSVSVNAAGNAVVDFGRHGCGWIEVDAERAGDYLFIWGELLNGKGSVETNELFTVREGAIRCAVTKGRFEGPAKNVRIPYVKGNGSVFHEGEVGKFGVVMPFRWLEVVRCPFPITRANVRQVPVYYPYDMSEESFSCDDANLVAVHDFCKHSIRATTYTGKFIDGDRERLPYEADSYITLLGTAAVTSDDTLSHAMVDYLATHTTWPTEWKQFFIRLVYEDWMRSGQTDLVRKHYKLMRVVKSWRHLRREDGLVVSRGPKAVAAPGGEQPNDIVDWGKCYRDGFVFCDVNAVVNALHYRNLVELAEMARAIGETADAAMFAREAQVTFAAYQKAFFDAGAGCYCDGEGTDHKTVQANAMALACGVVPEKQVSGVADYVSRKGFSCSTYMAQFVLEALFRAGRADRAFELMTSDGERSWRGMMAKGATITMEFWDLTLKEPGRVPDMNHAWSTAPLNMISRYVLGVTPSAPGWASASISPNPGPLARLSGKVPTPKGAISLEMEKVDGSWRAVVETPVPAVFTLGDLKREIPASTKMLLTW